MRLYLNRQNPDRTVLCVASWQLAGVPVLVSGDVNFWNILNRGTGTWLLANSFFFFLFLTLMWVHYWAKLVSFQGNLLCVSEEAAVRRPKSSSGLGTGTRWNARSLALPWARCTPSPPLLACAFLLLSYCPASSNQRSPPWSPFSFDVQWAWPQSIHQIFPCAPPRITLEKWCQTCLNIRVSGNLLKIPTPRLQSRHINAVSLGVGPWTSTGHSRVKTSLGSSVLRISSEERVGEPTHPGSSCLPRHCLAAL